MRTSSADKGSRATSGIRAVLVTLLVVALTDVLACLALVPYVGVAELMWREYRAQDAGSFDTVLVGSSVVAYGISPEKLDESLGSTSFNMGTPGQTLRDSLTSIQCAVAEHGVSRVILGIGYETMLEEPSINSSVAYTLGKSYGEPLWEAASDWLSLLKYDSFYTNEYSVAALFPFAYDHVELTVPAIAGNISRRMSMDYIDAAYAYAKVAGEKEWQYQGRGHISFGLVYPEAHLHGTRHASHESSAKTIPQNYDDLATLCTWCTDHGVSLYVIGSPYMPTALFEYEDGWVAAMREAQDVVESHGGHYMDLNMVRRNKLNLLPSHFVNAVHLNHDGAQLTSSYIGSAVRDIEQGIDLSNDFMPLTEEGWEQYRASIPFVDTIDYTTQTEGNTVTVTAQPVVGDMDVRYRFELKTGEKDVDWEVVRDYTTDPTYSFVFDEGVTEKTIRVRAYVKGDHEETPRMVEGTITI